MSIESSLIGAVVDGKYHVQSLLGRGGMGAVYRAVHVGTDRTVALKVIAGSFAGNEEYVERFRREARACGRLRHPGIVDVTDFGVATHAGQPLPYLVMEFLDGRTLADALREQPRPPLPWVIDVLEQACAAVEEAHRHGILHRDLKPENVWLEPDRRGGVVVKVLDFGLAKLDAGDAAPIEIPRAAPAPLVPDVDAGATFMSSMVAPTMASAGSSASTTSIAGTPAFMSPEQWRGESATTRSDVYSLGVMAYRMITGQLPFEGTVVELQTAQLEREPPPLRSIRPGVHDDAANLVALAMSKDPARRPASAGVFGNMLAAQLEPAGAFFARALVLCISRFKMFATLGLLTGVPFLFVSVLASAWQVAARFTELPPLDRRSAVLVNVALFVAANLCQALMGVMPLYVLHSLATPSKSLDVVALARANRERIRRWLAGVWPIVAGLLAMLALMVVFILLTRAFRTEIRTLPPAIRLVIIVSAVGVPFGLGYVALRRKGLDLRKSGLFGSVLLIEVRTFAEAVAHSAALMQESGGLRNAVQKWYLVIMMTVSLLIGGLLGATGVIGRSAGTFVMLSPLLAIPFFAFLTLNGVIQSLIYVSARRSKGESLDEIYGDVID